MFYHDSSAEVVKEGRWDEKSCVRRIGGFDIDKANLPTSMKWLPKGAVLALNDANGKAVLVKTVVVYENASKSADAPAQVKVEKGHALNIGDTLAGGVITAIEGGDGFDNITVATLPNAVKKGDVLDDVAGKTILGLNYATVKLDDMPSCTPTLVAYEIEEDSLPYPVNAAIKEALTCRHAFKI